jgi:DNA polymerase-3 subunit delta
MLRLDGTGITDPKAAAAMLGMSAFPAQKVLAQARRLGPERVARAISLIADADLDLRGLVDWPDELVIEVLVARLAQLVSLRGGAAAGAGRRAP